MIQILIISGSAPGNNVGKLCNRTKHKMVAIKMYNFTSRLHMKVLFAPLYSFMWLHNPYLNFIYEYVNHNHITTYFDILIARY